MRAACFLTTMLILVTGCQGVRTSSSDKAASSTTVQSQLTSIEQLVLARLQKLGITYQSNQPSFSGNPSQDEIQQTIQLIQQLIQEVLSLDPSNTSDQTQAFRQALLLFMNELLDLLQMMLNGLTPPPPPPPPDFTPLSLSPFVPAISIEATTVAISITGTCDAGNSASNMINWNLQLSDGVFAGFLGLNQGLMTTFVRSSDMTYQGQNLNSQCKQGRFEIQVPLTPIPEDPVDRTGLSTGNGYRTPYTIDISIVGFDSSGNLIGNPGTATVDLTPDSPNPVPSPIAPLQVSPDQITMPVTATLPMMASGGTPPFHYMITSGNCTVDFNQGLLTAAASPSVCQVTVIDSAGSTATATITVLQ